MSDQTYIDSPFRPGQDVTRVGLFGGTFDPVHEGHLHVAEEVRAAFGLEKVYVVPAAAPPHKTWKQVADPVDRLKMVRLCFKNHPGFVVSDVEVSRKGLSYSIDTIQYFLSRLAPCEQLMMMVGTDAFFEIHTWREFGGILNHVPLIVVMRPDDHGESRDTFPIKQMGTYLRDKVDKGYVWDRDRNGFFHLSYKSIYLFQGTPWPVSSTEIRRRLKNGENAASLLNREVYDYIIEKGLYT